MQRSTHLFAFDFCYFVFVFVQPVAVDQASSIPPLPLLYTGNVEGAPIYTDQLTDDGQWWKFDSLKFLMAIEMCEAEPMKGGGEGRGGEGRWGGEGVASEASHPWVAMGRQASG